MALVKLLSCVQLFAAPWTITYQRNLVWDFPGKSTGVGCHSLLQGIFPTQRLNPGLPLCRQMLYHLSHREATVALMVKNLPANAGDARNAGLIPASGRSPRVGNGIPFQYSGWKIPWAEELGGLQSGRPQRVMHDWVTKPYTHARAHTHTHTGIPLNFAKWACGVNQNSCKTHVVVDLCERKGRDSNSTENRKTTTVLACIHRKHTVHAENGSIQFTRGHKGTMTHCSDQEEQSRNSAGKLLSRQTPLRGYRSEGCWKQRWCRNKVGEGIRTSDLWKHNVFCHLAKASQEGVLEQEATKPMSKYPSLPETEKLVSLKGKTQNTTEEDCDQF